MPDRNPDPRRPRGAIRRTGILSGGALSMAAIVAFLTANPLPAGPAGPHTHTAADLGHPHSDADKAYVHTHGAADLPTSPPAHAHAAGDLPTTPPTHAHLAADLPTTPPAHTHAAGDLPADPDEIADSFTSSNGSVLNAGTADGLDLSIAQATETLVAGCELATVAEAQGEVDSTKCVTPEGVTARINDDINGDVAAIAGYTNTHSRAVAISSNSSADGIRSLVLGGFSSSSQGNAVSVISSSNSTVQNSNESVVIAGEGSNIDASTNSIVSGIQNNASGDYNFMTGFDSDLVGNGNIVSGRLHDIQGNFNGVSGSGNTATSVGGSLGGYNNTVSGQYSSAFGLQNDVSGNESSAIGNRNTVDGNFSHAKGTDLDVGGFQYVGIYGRNVTAAKSFSQVWGHGFGASASATSNRTMEHDTLTGDLDISGSLSQSVVFAGIGEKFLFNGKVEIGRFMTTDDGETARYAKADEPWVCVSRKKLALNMGGGSFTNTKFVLDADGDRVFEDYEEKIEVSPARKEGDKVIEAKFEVLKYKRLKLNPDFNPEKVEPTVDCEFKGRLWMKIDETVKAGSWIKSGDEGIATASDVAYGWKVVQVKDGRGLVMAGIFNGFDK